MYLNNISPKIHLYLNNLNTYGSFIMSDSLVLSPNEILPIAQENKYLGIF